MLFQCANPEDSILQKILPEPSFGLTPIHAVHTLSENFSAYRCVIWLRRSHRIEPSLLSGFPSMSLARRAL
jgi:hypothetical protein